MTDLVKIKNSDLNSNNWVDLNANHFQPSYGKRVAVNPLDGQFSGTSFIISTADIIGIENPTFSVKGVINPVDFNITAEIWSTNPSSLSSVSEDGSSMVGKVTLGYLFALWRNVSGNTYLQINFGDLDNKSNWRNYVGADSNIKVELQSMNTSPREDAEGNHIVDYTLNFVETN